VKRIAIIQSAYVPWRGFFDLIAQCDEYVIFDSVQFVKRHWHNRNILKSSLGPIWITIPVISKSRFLQPIDAVSVAEPWANRHWNTIVANYSRARYFDRCSEPLGKLYEQAAHSNLLSEINEIFLRGIVDMLGIATHITRDSAYKPIGEKTDRLVDICLKAGATHYLSGPAAMAYIEEDKLTAHGIKLEWMSYDGYRSYPQLWGAFFPKVSIIDLILNAGPCSPCLWRAQRFK
jgi:hypothetical protein